MKYINLNNIILSDCIGIGSFGSIRKCYINNKLYAFKCFKEPRYLDGKKDNISKISKVSNDKQLITPNFWVIANNKKIGYISNFCDGYDIGFNTSNIIEEIKNAKEVIKRMHSYKIIHGDLISSNIMVKDKKAFIIDFDNSSINGSKINVKHTNDLSYEYINKLGVNNALDVFIFNLLTFSSPWQFSFLNLPVFLSTSLPIKSNTFNFLQIGFSKNSGEADIIMSFE